MQAELDLVIKNSFKLEVFEEENHGKRFDLFMGKPVVVAY